ncbi:hypothetical protein TPB0596_01530 [Tsukamurella pulmonis]|uniref:glycoside hydrolase family 5 protein n=1 Tax=Tsukamurella pulmonis TaxID=47312 RepID=UPI0009EAC011|nr:cellulase family glycosylhydrolase [Tsukamurella pulmonis]RDH13167.1 glycoside hydrolase [Tsukamurella pulmonis]BDD80390.1 hypothetical protein TPB0596_01530 [Tsukamurella pulmonis]
MFAWSRRHHLAMGAILTLAFALLPAAPAQANGTLGFSQRGVNTNMLFIQSQTAFTWPDEPVSKFGEPQTTYTYIASRGHKYVRIFFDWDVIQRGLTPTNTTAPLDTKYAQKVTAEITKAKTAGLKVVLVLGNACRWQDRTNDPDWAQPGPGADLLCGRGLSDAHAANLWRQVSSLYKNEPAVAAYDLFNEPSAFQHPTRADMQDPTNWPAPYSAYKSAVNASIAAIRANGDNKYIWVESLCCTLYHDFASTDPGGPWVVDPANRVQYSQHMYPTSNPAVFEAYDPLKEDPNYDSAPGQYWSKRGYITGFLNRLDTFAWWCSTYNVKCSIGEVGWSNDLLPGTAGDATKWNALGDEYYNKANWHGFDVMFFGVASGLQGVLVPYSCASCSGWVYPAPGVTKNQSSALVIEQPQHLSK